MKKLLQRLFKRPVTRLAARLSSSPEKDKVFASLTALLNNIQYTKETYGIRVPFDLNTGKFIIFSDAHKGARDLADDFRPAEKNYLNALDYYYKNGFYLINLGDCEELWENKPDIVMEMNKAEFQEELRFLQDNRYYRVFGNHDLEWKYEFPRMRYLKPVFGDKLKIYEGLILTTTYNNREYSIFCTHGHQGDQKSDGNTFSTWFVAAIWTPLQRFLEISINSTSDSFELVDKHNIMMYEWSATQKDLLFISGHTHKPVFASLDHIERLNKQLEKTRAKEDATAIRDIEAELEKRKAEYAGKQFHKTMVIPSYFNSGCCCFIDGDITGIEIEGDNIRLVKWKEESGQSHRIILEQSPLSYLFEKISATQ
ncbi:metallophosphoesterase [Niastella populi]|uniref:Metallophosphoesterase n=1 Tax=Niastella populi TaxID=550983 RepID=A0A1V9EUL6_9BACT|nr:metallophosphoesterase [Niastella populi]OQP49857.1 metallophosphoesterase [Niastella populi]